MNEIVVISDGQAVTTTLVIAEGTGYDHASVIKLVRKYLGDLQEFGEVGFEIRLNQQGSPTEFANLNQEQSAICGDDPNRDHHDPRGFAWERDVAALDLEAIQDVGISGIWFRAKRGKNGRIWLHPDLVVRFAQRLDMRFSTWRFRSSEAKPKMAVQGNSRLVSG